MTVETAIALLGALGFGAMVTTWMGWIKDTRIARSQVLTSLALVEQLRYAPDPEDRDTYLGRLEAFRHAQRELAVAAMLARLPRGVVATYLDLAAASFTDSSRSWSSGQVGEAVTIDPHDPKVAGNIASDLNDLVRRARELISDLVWHRWRTLWRRRRRHMALLTRRDQLIAKDPSSPLSLWYNTP